MTEVTFEMWINPKCSTCQKTLALLEEKGIQPQLKHYLDDAPTRVELERALSVLGVGARGILRTKETVYTELGLENASDDEILSAMEKHPVLIQRPIVMVGDRGVVARPPETVLELLGA